MSLQVILLVSQKPDRLQSLTEIMVQDGLISVVYLDPDSLLEQALKDCLPDLVLIDHESLQSEAAGSIEMICNTVRDSLAMDYRPGIVILGSDESILKRIDYFVSGADDILPNTLPQEELRVRILAHLRRTLDILSNRITQLPNEKVLGRILQRKFQRKEPWALLSIRINTLSLYQQIYGVVPFERVLRTFAMLMTNLLRPPDWSGHTGSDHFLVLTHPDKAEKIAAILCRQFDAQLETFYSESDRQRGYMMASEKQATYRVGLMRLAVGVVHSNRSSLDSFNMALGMASQFMSFAASTPDRSDWISDRFKLTASPECSESSLTPAIRVLLVESDGPMAFLLKSVLELQSYEVLAAQTEREAQALVSEKAPDLMILDPLLNGAPSGWALCRWVKEHAPMTKVILTSTLHERELAEASGADLYLEKPFDIIPLLTWAQKLVMQNPVTATL